MFICLNNSEETIVDLNKVWLYAKDEITNILFSCSSRDAHRYVEFQSREIRDKEYNRIKSLLLNLPSDRVSHGEG